MEEEEHSDDSSGSESDLQKQIEELQAAVEQTPYHYDSHVQLIGLLRQLGDLDGARKARNSMSEVFPLTEGLWLEWIRDEMPLVSLPEAAMELRQVFERATEDYLSVPLWLEYAQFAIDHMSTMPEGMEFPRDVFERAIVSCGLHVSKAGELWDTYREFEVAILSPIQDMQQKSPDDESLNTQLATQFERVEKVFKRQLAVPLIGMEDTFKEYQQFDAALESHPPAYHRALKRLEVLLPFENELASSSPPSLESYQSYLSHAKSSKEDPMFINTLYQRAVADHCLEVALWKEYLTYLNTTFGKVSSVLLPPHKQAVRNCPWIVELWVSWGRALERVGAQEEEIAAVYEKGLSGGNFTAAKDHLQLWTAYLDYRRRRVGNHDNMEEAEPELVDLRKTFKRARDTLETYYGRDGDPTDVLARYQASLEARCYGNTEEARFLWDDVMSRHGREARYWIEYAEMERNYGDTELCRKLLQRAVNSASDDPERVCEALLQFEREEGDLASYEAALERCAAQMRRVGERREKAVQKDVLQKESKKQRKKAEKAQKKAAAGGGGAKQSSPGQQKAGGKRKRAQAGLVFFQEEEEEEEEEGEEGERSREGPAKKQKVAEDQSPPSTAVEKTGSKQQTHPVSSSPQVAMETQQVAVEMPRKIPEPPGRPKKSVKEEETRGGGGGGGGGREGGRMEVEEGGEKGVKEGRTVFVSNLRLSVTKQQIMETFSECGSISDIRLVKTQSRGRANAFAYVEFATVAPVEKALQLDRHDLAGRIMFVSPCKEKGGPVPSKTARFKTDNKATVFVSNIQHNMNEENLRNLFEKCGEIKEIRLVRNRDGRPKGFAYVEYVQESSATAAVMQFDTHLLGLKKINVAISNPPKRKGGADQSRPQGQAVPFNDGPSQMKQQEHTREDVKFVRPSFIPPRLRTQEPTLPPSGPKKRTNVALLPRALARQGSGMGEGQEAGTERSVKGGEVKGEGGEEGKGGGEEGGEAMEEESARKGMSNDDFRNLLK